MKKRYYSSMSMLLAAMFMVCTFWACTFGSDEIPSENGIAEANSELVLNLRTTSGQSARTRAALTTTISPTNEAVVKNMVVGIFKTDGTASKIEKFTVSELGANASANGLQQNVSTSYTATTQAVSKIELNDKVLVAINVPEARFDDFTAAANYNAFKALELSIAEAITNSASGTDIAEDALPMWGEGKVEANGSTFKSDITVVRMVAKVSLASLTANFAETLHPNAKFQLEEVFLLNVPNATNLDYTWNGTAGDYTYQFSKIVDSGDAVTSYYTGEDGLTTYPTEANAVQKFQADYVGSGALTVEPITTGAAAITGYTFYTLPNNSATYNTKLIIKGQYTDDDTIDPLASNKGHDAYYAVDLYPDKTNDPTNKNILPNYNYSVTVVIKGDGADNAYKQMPKIESIESTVTTLDFDDYQNTIVFNGGITPEPFAPAKVGDYYYADGTWSSEYIYDVDNPVIGLVFSTDVSATDYAAGFTHGYVLALNDVTSSATFTWGPAGETGMGLLNKTSYTAFDGTQYSESSAQMHAIMEDYDGYSHSMYIKDHKTLSDYPAFNAAMTTYESAVKAPKTTNTPAAKVNSSGWYLPSIGQQYVLCKNFCNLAPNNTVWPGVTESPRENAAYRDFYYSNKADATTTALNKVLTQRLTTDVVAAGHTAITHTQFKMRSSSANQLYWSSTEFSGANAFNLYFYIDGNLYFYANNAKSESWYVRPVLAF